MSTVHVVVPARPSTTRRVRAAATPTTGGCAAAWRAWGGRCGSTASRGTWPRADGPSRAALAATLAGIPADAVVLLDGLVASAAPEVLVPEASRLRLVVLVHLPLGVDPALDGRPRPRRATSARASARPCTPRQPWSRRAGGPAAGSWRPTAWRRTGCASCRRGSTLPRWSRAARRVDALVCVGAVTPTKGQDLLVEALADVADLDGPCTCVGSDARRPAVRRAGPPPGARPSGVGDRLRFTGPRVGRDLDAVYAAADLVVAPSRTETYGMVVTEALARGIPVVGAEVGGLPEALGRTAGRTAARHPRATRATPHRSPQRCAGGSRTPGCATTSAGRLESAAPPLPTGP